MNFLVIISFACSFMSSGHASVLQQQQQESEHKEHALHFTRHFATQEAVQAALMDVDGHLTRSMNLMAGYEHLGKAQQAHIEGQVTTALHQTTDLVKKLQAQYSHEIYLGVHGSSWTQLRDKNIVLANYLSTLQRYWFAPLIVQLASLNPTSIDGRLRQKYGDTRSFLRASLYALRQYDHPSVIHLQHILNDSIILWKNYHTEGSGRLGAYLFDTEAYADACANFIPKINKVQKNIFVLQSHIQQREKVILPFGLTSWMTGDGYIDARCSIAELLALASARDTLEKLEVTCTNLKDCLTQASISQRKLKVGNILSPLQAMQQEVSDINYMLLQIMGKHGACYALPLPVSLQKNITYLRKLPKVPLVHGHYTWLTEMVQNMATVLPQAEGRHGSDLIQSSPDASPHSSSTVAASVQPSSATPAYHGVLANAVGVDPRDVRTVVGKVSRGVSVITDVVEQGIRPVVHNIGSGVGALRKTGAELGTELKEARQQEHWIVPIPTELRFPQDLAVVRGDAGDRQQLIDEETEKLRTILTDNRRKFVSSHMQAMRQMWSVDKWKKLVEESFSAQIGRMRHDQGVLQQEAGLMRAMRAWKILRELCYTLCFGTQVEQLVKSKSESLAEIERIDSILQGTYSQVETFLGQQCISQQCNNDFHVTLTRDYCFVKDAISSSKAFFLPRYFDGEVAKIFTYAESLPGQLNKHLKNEHEQRAKYLKRMNSVHLAEVDEKQSKDDFEADHKHAYYRSNQRLQSISAQDGCNRSWIHSIQDCDASNYCKTLYRKVWSEYNKHSFSQNMLSSDFGLFVPDIMLACMQKEQLGYEHFLHTRTEAWLTLSKLYCLRQPLWRVTLSAFLALFGFETAAARLRREVERRFNRAGIEKVEAHRVLDHHKKLQETVQQAINAAREQQKQKDQRTGLRYATTSIEDFPALKQVFPELDTNHYVEDESAILDDL